MRLVSKHHLSRELADGVQLSFGDQYVLLLAMQILSRPLRDDDKPINELYLHLKQCLLHIEAQNFLSLKLLQAELLIALYEIGHAIYPAAYISIAHCARLGHALSLHDLRTSYRILALPRGCPVRVNSLSANCSKARGSLMKSVVELGGVLLCLTGISSSYNRVIPPWVLKY